MGRSGLSLLLLLTAGSAILSCKSYYIPVESFKKQFAGMDKAVRRDLVLRGLMNERLVYKVYPIDSIYCVDRKGRPVVLANSPSWNIEITDNHKRKAMLPFYRLIFQKNAVLCYEAVPGTGSSFGITEGYRLTERAVFLPDSIGYPKNSAIGYENFNGTAPYGVTGDNYSFVHRGFSLDSISKIRILHGKTMRLYDK